jgi:hypothetical protein
VINDRIKQQNPVNTKYYGLTEIPTFTASTFFCFMSAAQWRYVNLATDVTKASLCVCMHITEVTCTADLNPCKHCNVAALSSLWSSVTLNAAIIGAQQTSIMNLKIVVSVITENTDLQKAQASINCKHQRIKTIAY